MINQTSLSTVEQAAFGPQFCRPLYNTYCFSKIPGTIKTLLGVPTPSLPSDCFENRNFKTVVFFLMDAFGWEVFEKYADQHPFLKRCIQKGIVSKLTSQFPSTTAAHITCFNTDREVGDHGIYEWFYYEPTVDRVIAPLFYSFAGDKQPGTLANTTASIEKLCPYETLYEQLQQHDIPSTILQPSSIAPSPYTQWAFRGAEHLYYDDFKQGLEQVLEKMTHKEGLYYIYFSEMDSEGHKYGHLSKEVEAAYTHAFDALEECFYSKLGKQNEDMAILVSADHGMTTIDPRSTFYLNKEIPEIVKFLQVNAEGRLLVPAGSCRDFFLHVRIECLEDALKCLNAHPILSSIARICRTEDLIQQGFFGSKQPSSTFLARVGNVVILPYENQAVWWLERGKFDQHYRGMHGGLTRSEMEIPFLFLTS